MTILDRVEASLVDFRPRTPREFVALQLSRRFADLAHLARYLLAAQRHSKRALLTAANDARLRHALNRAPMPVLFFEVLDESARKEAA
jgi:hypothetical protein